MDLLFSLMATGFSEYEAKVYLALLVENPATGYQVSKKAGIPRSMVYEALGRLSVRGAVLRADDQRATLYRPLPPDILLDRYEKEHRGWSTAYARICACFIKFRMRTAYGRSAGARWSLRMPRK